MDKPLEQELLREESSSAELWVLFGVIVVAAALRLYGIASWPIQGDEGYSISNGLTVKEKGVFAKHIEWMHPAYFLILGGLYKVTGSAGVLLSRLPAFVFGVLSFPLFWLFGRRLMGRRLTSIALVIIALSEWHIRHSKQARFYSAVFLLGGLAALLLYSAVWEQRPWRALAACVLGVLSATFHASGAGVILGSVCYLCVLGLVPRLRPPHGLRRAATWYLLPLGVIVLPGLVLAVCVAGVWSGKGLQWNYTPIHTVLGIVRAVGLTVSLAAVAGAVVCALKRPRLAVFLVCLPAPSMLILILVSPLVDVRPDYLFAVTPAIFFLAAAFCVVPYTDLKLGAPRTRYVAACAAVVAFSLLPTTLSHFTEKGKDGPRVVASLVKSLARPDDRIVAYLRGVDRLVGRRTYRVGQMYSRTTKWREELRRIQNADCRTWFVLSYPRVGLPDQLDVWLCSNARLLKRWRAKRYDYLTRDIEVWLYDPGKSRQQAAGPEGPPEAAPREKNEGNARRE